MGLIIKITGKQAKWSGGLIPYVFDDTWEKQDIDAVLIAMKEWENRTGGVINFQWKNNGSGQVDSWIYLTHPTHSKCATGLDASKPGKIECGINILGKGFEDIKKTALHELGHCIGLGHEQLRTDTPIDHVQKLAKSDASSKMSKGNSAILDYGVKSTKTIDNALETFKFSQQAATYKYDPVGEYDPQSIMLYGGGNTAISDGDVASVRQLYTGNPLVLPPRPSDEKIAKYLPPPLPKPPSQEKINDFLQRK